MKKYTGHCHCKAVQYACEMELEKGLACNCSHCYAKGFLLAFIPENQFSLLKGEEALTEYRFNKKAIAHLFCKTCGVQCFGYGSDPAGNKMIAINLRTVEDVDLDTLPRQEFNGKDV